jgi:cytochrome P450
MFPEADQFDIPRGEASRHLTFGSGIHLCSGAALARSEGRIALGALLDRTSDIVRVHRQDPVHEPDLTVRKLHSLPLVLEPAQ